jgi:MoxR-like ATPase
MQNLQQKMIELVQDVNKTVCEREELISMVAIALLSRNNIFILGDTGQAKSYAVNQFRKRIVGARQFEKLMSKQSDEEQLFGRLDITGLIRGENPAMITAGKIPDSHIVFLDEIFKAGEGILNSLLTALNERVWTNEGEVVELPVISFFSASNEIPNFNNPEEKILKPLYDRFQLKVLTNYVTEKEHRLNMLKIKQSGANAVIGRTITLGELEQMQAEVLAVEIPERINELMDTILCELRRKSIAVSDRKFFNYAPIVQAAAWLDGKTAINEQHMLTLVNYLWNTPQEIESVRDTVYLLCKNPISAELEDITADALESYDQFEAADNKPKALNKLRNELLRLFAKMQELTAKSGDNPVIAKSIRECAERLDDFNKKSCISAGFTYVNLAELAIIRN